MYYSDYNRSPEDREPIESFNYHVGNSVPPKPGPKNRVWAKFVAVGLACALVGGLAGGAGMMALSGAFPQNGTTVYEGTHAPTVVNVSQVTGKEKLTASQIYAAYVDSTVGITVESVTTNIWGQRVAAAAAGSGFVITEDGYIVTNYHVIEGASTVNVAFVDGKTYPATVVGGDADNDIAVLKIEATGLKPVIIGDSTNLVVGEDVVAIGNPLGELTYTMTNGIVSAMDRSVTMSGGTSMNMIQTNTAINSGNSGGPLFNMYGQVIGITSAKLSNSTNSSEATIEGLGFAIPINDVWGMIQDIMEDGHISKAYMGITPSEVSQAEAEKYGVSLGVYVSDVGADTPAQKAGLQKGDIITALDDQTITSYSDLKTALKQYKAGDKATLTVDRSGEALKLDITFTEYPQETEDTSAQQPVQQPQQDDSYYYQFPFGSFPFG